MDESAGRGGNGSDGAVLASRQFGRIAGQHRSDGTSAGFGGRDEFPRGAAGGDEPSAVSHQPSAVSHQPSAVSHQQSEVSHQPSAVSHQPSEVRSQPCGYMGDGIYILGYTCAVLWVCATDADGRYVRLRAGMDGFAMGTDRHALC